MKNEGKTRAVTRFGLLAMALVFCFMTTAARAQEEPPIQVQVQEGTVAQPSQEGAEVPDTGTQPSQKSAEAPQDGPKTIGEMWERKLSPDDSEATSEGSEATSEGSEVSPNSVPTASELNFPENREKSENWATEGRVGESTFFDKLLEVCWSLAFICILVWLAGKVAQRFGVSKIGLPGASESLIEILEKKRLSPGRSVILMRIGPKVLAVAATEGGCETLTEFELDDFNKFKDSKVTRLPVEPDEEGSVPKGRTTPADIARHYLSIIPGTGAKK